MCKAHGRQLDTRIAALVPAVRGIARRLEADAARRSELEQEMLIAVWASLDRFDGESPVRTLAWRVTRQVARRHAHERRSDELRHALTIDALEGMASEANPETTITQRERVAILAKLIDGLSPLEKRCILLDLQEHESWEISAAAGLSPTQVLDWLHMARERLRLGLRKIESRMGQKERTRPVKSEPRSAPKVHLRPLNPAPRAPKRPTAWPPHAATKAKNDALWLAVHESTRLRKPARPGGRPRIYDRERIAVLAAQGLEPKDIVKATGIPRAAISRILVELGMRRARQATASPVRRIRRAIELQQL